jgi:hypothetical protein
MKRLFAIICLCVIVWQTLSGLFVIGTFYLNRSYISQNICENRFDAIKICRGKCFLEKTLNQKVEREQKLPDLTQKEVSVYCQTASQDFHSLNLQPVLISYIKTIEIQYLDNFQSAIFHPPRLI